MPDLLLCALNAKYAHTAFGLRYLQANLGDLEARSLLLEATLEDRPVDVAERILAHSPRIVGLSVYIWNAAPALELVRLLKQLQPALLVVLGGPEVSYETESQEIVARADYTVTQEGDLVFPDLCRRLLSGERPASKIVAGGQAPLEQIAFPYRLYSDHDLAHRVVYVEASRGCPFRCEFCLSSLEQGVRHFSWDRLRAELEGLWQRGARRFKFIDRTFNLRLEISRSILDFFLERYEEGLFLHFEMVPDRFPPDLRQLVARFPAGALQFEIGIQSFDAAVGERISRRQDLGRLEDNLRYLRQHTGVHIHADLIVGLPGEDLDCFGRGFDRLVALDPQEIQVGILKRLRGTAIVRHDLEWDMVYNATPPYEVLQTSSVTFADMQRMKRFARYWDLLANRGHFPHTLRALLGDSPFVNFLALSDWLFATTCTTHKLGVPRLAELLVGYWEGQLSRPFAEVAHSLALDHRGSGYGPSLPSCLLSRADLPPDLLARRQKPPPRIPARQARHLRQD